MRIHNIIVYTIYSDGVPPGFDTINLEGFILHSNVPSVRNRLETVFAVKAAYEV